MGFPVRTPLFSDWGQTTGESIQDVSHLSELLVNVSRTSVAGELYLN